MSAPATTNRRRVVSSAGAGDPATRLRRLAGRVRRLGDPYRGDPARPMRERQEIETELLKIARQLDAERWG